MPEPPPAGRREVRQCPCGHTIVFEVGPGKRPDESGGELHVVAISTESGASIQTCPRCGTAVEGPGEQR